MTCLLCKHFHPTPPKGWKPDYDGDTYSAHDVRRLMRKNNGEDHAGQCMLEPRPQDVYAFHGCGQFEPQGFAIITDRTFIWGTYSEQHTEALEAKLAKATAALKAARKVSRSRLERLQRKSRKG